MYPRDAITEAKEYVNQGFTGMKLKVGFGVKEDIEYIRAVRKAIGYDIKLMADFNCAYSQDIARKIIFELQNEKLEFFEELLPPEDIDGYCAIRNLTGSYITAGENLFGKQNFMRWMGRGALDIYQPDLCSSGGFTECRKIAALAEAHNVRVIPHVWSSGVGLAASLQFIATLTPTPLSYIPVHPSVEFDRSNHPFRLDLIGADSIRFNNGFMEIPTRPGIGVTVNRDVIERYKINK